MTLGIAHNYVSTSGDSVDPTLIGQTHWNENHVITMSSGDLLGRTTASDGPAELITIGAGLAMSALALSVVFANPSATIGLTAANGTATTAMRSDATPALSQAITPNWTGIHTFSNATNSALFTGGNVGIGTTTPAKLLTVSASDTGTTLTAGSAAALAVANTNTTAGNFAELGFRTTDSGASDIVASKIVSVFTSHTAAAMSADLAFLTRNAGTLAERVRILANGNVGIGTTTPLGIMDVKQAADQHVIVESGSSRGGSNGIGITSINDANNAYKSLVLTGSVVVMNAAGSGGGNVGVGVASPGKNLDVNGEARVQSASYPKFWLDNTGNGTDLKKWQLYCSDTSGIAQLQAVNDAESVGSGFYTFDRSGNFTASNSISATGGIASTSTTTGALVATGGLGVSGAIYAGGLGHFGGTLFASGAVQFSNYTAGLAVFDASGNITSQTTPLTSLGTIRCVPLTAVNFNAANTDHAITVSLPAGVTRWAVSALRISNASGTLTTATAGLFTATGGGGIAICSNTAVTVSTSATDTNNNYMSLGANNPTSEAYNETTVYFRVGTAQGSAVTGDVILTIIPLS